MTQATSSNGTAWTYPADVFTGRLASPAQLEQVRQNMPSAFRPDTVNRWQLLSHAPEALLQALDNAVPSMAAQVQTSPNGVHYAIFTLQLRDMQHRFVMPVCMPGFTELIAAACENRVDMLLGTTNGVSIKAMPLAGVSSDATLMRRIRNSVAENTRPGILANIADELPMLVDHLLECSALPSLNGEVVRQVSLSVVMPPAILPFLPRR